MSAVQILLQKFIHNVTESDMPQNLWNWHVINTSIIIRSHRSTMYLRRCGLLLL